MATFRNLPADDVHRGMDLLEAVHRGDTETVRELKGFWRQAPGVLRGRRPMWQVMADVAEDVVMLLLRIQEQQHSPEEVDAFGAGGLEPVTAAGAVAEVLAESVGTLARTAGPAGSTAGADVVLSYVRLVAGEDGVEPWLRHLRALLLGKSPGERPLPPLGN